MGQRIAGAERAQPDHDGERHRAHRVDLARRHQRSSRSSSSRPPTSRPRSRRSSRSMQTQVRQLPPGITPPLIIKYSASSIPVVQLGMSSPTLPEQTVFDAAINIAAAAADHDPRRRDPVPLRRQEPADLGRPRHAGAAGARPGAGRRRQRGQPAEPDPAVGHRQVRRHRVRGAHERLARRDRRPQRPAGAHQRRHDHLPARRRPRARRLLAADQHRAPGRRARRAAVGAQERRRVDARHRRQPARRCCRGSRRRCRRRRQGDAAVRPVGVRQGGGQGRGHRGADRRRRSPRRWCCCSSATGAAR